MFVYSWHQAREEMQMELRFPVILSKCCSEAGALPSPTVYHPQLPSLNRSKTILRMKKGMGAGGRLPGLCRALPPSGPKKTHLLFTPEAIGLSPCHPGAHCLHSSGA